MSFTPLKQRTKIKSKSITNQIQLEFDYFCAETAKTSTIETITVSVSF